MAFFISHFQFQHHEYTKDVNFKPSQRGHEWYQYEEWVISLNPDHTDTANITPPCKLSLLRPAEALKSGVFLSQEEEAI